MPTPKKSDDDRADEETEKSGPDDDHIRSVVRSVLDEYLGDDGKDDKGDDDKEPDHEVKSPREMEGDTFKVVREAMRSLKEEEAHEAEHKKIRQIEEKAPEPVRALTKAFWG